MNFASPLACVKLDNAALLLGGRPWRSTSEKRAPHTPDITGMCINSVLMI